MGGLWHEMEELRSAQHDWENPPEDDPEKDEEEQEEAKVWTADELKDHARKYGAYETINLLYLIPPDRITGGTWDELFAEFESAIYWGRGYGL